MKKESPETICQDGDLLLGECEGEYYLFRGEQCYWLSDHPYEPFSAFQKGQEDE